MRHLSLKKLTLQFFLVGAYMGYYISNGFGFGITTPETDTIAIVDDQENISDTAEETEIYIRFHNNIDQYVEEFSQEESEVIDFFVAQAKKAQERSGYSQELLYKVNHLLVILYKEFGLQEVSTSLIDLEEGASNSKGRNNHYKVSLKTDDVSKVIERMKNSPLIKYIEPVPTLSITQNNLETESSENRYRQQIESHIPIYPTPKTKNENVIVAVLDNAINTEHPLISDHIYGEYDIANNDIDASAPVDSSTRNHGTHVAGSIVQSVKTILPDKKIKLLAIKIAPDQSDGTKLTHIVEGIQKAILSGANIINMSFGGCLPHQYSYTLHEIISNHPDVSFIASAGNQNKDPMTDHCEHNILGTMEAGSYGFYPAAVDTTNIIAVGATQEQDAKRSLTNYGSYVDLSAPGKGILSSVGKNSYEKRDGTSIASSIVAGAATTLMMIDTDIVGGRDIKKALINASTKLDQNGMGAGRINYCKMLDNTTSYSCKSTQAFSDPASCNQNQICEYGEDKNNCSSDCGCNNDSVCEAARGENRANCEQDCSPTSCNNNGICESNETIKHCSTDCGCDFDGICDITRKENPLDCPYDCKKNSTTEKLCNDGKDNDKDGLMDCGDSDCNGHISCFATLAATGSCGNGTLDSGETCDDGGTGANDGCTSSCARETPTCKVNIVLAEGDNANKATLLNLGYTDQTWIRVKNIDRGEDSNNSTNITLPVSHTYTLAKTHNVIIKLENKNDSTKSVQCSETIEIKSIQGCTDANASNYEEAATTDDGSCKYANSNDFYCQQLNIKKIAEEGDNGEYIMNFKWTITPAVEYVSVYPGEESLYKNTTSPLSHTYSAAGKYNAKLIVKANSGVLYNCHTKVEIGKKGCTYPEADNFDLEAAVDDGTCVISPGEGFVNILTRLPYRYDKLHGHVQYSHKPELVDITVQVLQDEVIILEFFPALLYDGTFTIPLQAADQRSENYVSPGQYTILYKAEHRKGTYIDTQSYDITIN